MATTDSGSSGDDQAPVEDARDELQAAVPEAAATLRDLLDADKETVQIRAAETILDRAGLTKGERATATTLQEDVGGATRDDPFDDLLS